MSGGSCYNCNPVCASCYGPYASNCYNCAELKILFNGICYDNCPAGYYKHETNTC